MTEAVTDAVTYASRVDRKYLLAESEVQKILAENPALWRLEEVSGHATQQYVTDYFDTPSLDFFHAARGRRPRRSKVRVRHYLATADHFIEVKRRNARGETTKVRAPWKGSLAAAEPFLRESLGADEIFVNLLASVARTSYERTALALNGNARMTIDRELRVGPHHGFTHELRELEVPGAQVSYPLGDLVIVETKSTNLLPTVLDRCLWERGHRPHPISKYALAVASFQPNLPLNRWTHAAAYLCPVTSQTATVLPA